MQKKLTAILLFFFSLFFLPSVFAHGSLEFPISRVYNCYKENPENPKSAACKAAVAAGGTQALYDWNGINQGAANDRHQEIIPDGTLCAGGRELFKGMNLARNDWPTTTIFPNGSGQVEFTWLATAPHATKYLKIYITKPTYDPTQPLKWSDLEASPFCNITSVTLVNSRYKLTCPMPAGSGKRTLFLIWQRSDSPEGFYACSDVVLGSGGVTTSWNFLGDLFANTSLVPNTKVNFRVMKHDGAEQLFSVVVPAAQSAADLWPHYLASTVNQSSTVRIGRLNAQTGEVVPVQSATANKIYINDPNVSHYHFAIDFILPSEGIDFIYPDGISTYDAGTIVMGSDQKRYQCKPWPASGWCKQSPFYYEPGKGLAWQDAWNLLS